MEKYKCYKCNGKGKLIILNEFFRSSNVVSCFICHGEGELDWVENARGRKKTEPIPIDSSAAVINRSVRKPYGTI